MYQDLLSVLIEKQIITKGTELTVKTPGYDLSGLPTLAVEENVQIEKATKTKNGNIKLYTFSTRDGKKYIVNNEQIVRIDDMEPKRLAEVYNLKEDGTHKPQGKRRGRKPKNRQVEAV